MRLVLLGPPGAGKGTQAAYVSAALGIPAISTGDIFRANVSGGTPLGLQARQYMDAGKLVPDEVTNAMVRDRLGQVDTAEGFLLDGYPRNLAQAAELDDILDGTPLDRVVELCVDTDQVVLRLLGRAAEQGRADDTEDVVRHRLDVYALETAPLSDHYDSRGLLVQVDGDAPVDTVTARLLSALRG